MVAPQVPLRGKAKLLSLGVYPEAGLKQARAKRDEARKHLAAGVDPSEARKAAKAARGGEDSLVRGRRAGVGREACATLAGARQQDHRAL
jgi:Arm DNA-binding domain